MPFAAVAAAHEPAILPQPPAFNGPGIVFGYATNLWRVGTGGGNAVRLTAGAEAGSYSCLSPDSKTIALVMEPVQKNPKKPSVEPVDPDYAK